MDLVIIILLVLLWINRNRMSIPEGLSLYFANKGTGKTTLLSYYAWMALNKRKYKKKYPNGVYCTVPISGCKLINVKEHLGKVLLENCLILVDEGALEFDNTMRLPDVQKMFFRLQRHYSCDVIVISQSWEDININLRRLYDNMYIMSRSVFLKHLHLSYIREIKKFIDINEESQKPEDFYRWKYPQWLSMWFFRRPWYKYFDTHYRPYELKETVYEQFPVEHKKPHIHQQVLHYIGKNGKIQVDKVVAKIRDSKVQQEDQRNDVDVA